MQSILGLWQPLHAAHGTAGAKASATAVTALLGRAFANASVEPSTVVTAALSLDRLNMTGRAIRSFVGDATEISKAAALSGALMDEHQQTARARELSQGSSCPLLCGRLVLQNYGVHQFYWMINFGGRQQHGRILHCVRKVPTNSR